MKTIKITAAQLKAAGACPQQLKLFKECFGQSANISKGLAEQLSQSFSVLWLSRNLLSLNYRLQFNSSSDAFFAELNSRREGALSQAKALHATASEDSKVMFAWLDFERIRVVAIKEFYEKLAVLFWDLYYKQTHPRKPKKRKVTKSLAPVSDAY